MYVAIVDDNNKLIENTLSILAKHTNITCVFTANSGSECIKKLISVKQLPQVILMDINMRKMNGCSAAYYIKHYCKGIKILMYSGYANFEAVKHSLICGADGYFLKTLKNIELISSIEAIANGNLFVNNLLLQNFTQQQIEELAQIHTTNCTKFFDTDTDKNFFKLTKKEKQFICLLIAGLEYNDIADIMCVSKKSIESYYTKAAKKMGVTNNREMVIVASQYGLIPQINLLNFGSFAEVA